MTFIKNCFQIDELFTTPYNPSQNGLVERQIQTVSGIIKKVTTERLEVINEWPKTISTVQFAINQRFSQATKFQPFQLMFGRNAFFPVKWSDSVESEEKIIEKWMQVYEKLYPTSQENMRKYQTKMKEDVDSSRKKVVNQTKGGEFQVGDVVYYWNKGKNSKWDPDFLGPGRIVSVNKRTGNFTICEVDDQEAILINNAPPQWIRPFGPGSVAVEGNLSNGKLANAN